MGWIKKDEGAEELAMFRLRFNLFRKYVDGIEIFKIINVEVIKPIKDERCDIMYIEPDRLKYYIETLDGTIKEGVCQYYLELREVVDKMKEYYLDKNFIITKTKIPKGGEIISYKKILGT